MKQPDGATGAGASKYGSFSRIAAKVLNSLEPMMATTEVKMMCDDLGSRNPMTVNFAWHDAARSMRDRSALKPSPNVLRAVTLLCAAFLCHANSWKLVSHVPVDSWV